jgi:hypothetical protein
MKKIIYILFAMFISIYGQNSDIVKDQLKNSGYNQKDIERIIRDRGLNQNQIDTQMNIKQETGTFENQSMEQEPLMIDDDQNTDQLDKTNDLNKTPDTINVALDYYGYNIFQGNPEIFQASKFGFVDPNYNIGPGDQIIVMLWGESQFRQEFTVDREGYVFVFEV